MTEPKKGKRKQERKKVRGLVGKKGERVCRREGKDWCGMGKGTGGE